MITVSASGFCGAEFCGTPLVREGFSGLGAFREEFREKKSLGDAALDSLNPTDGIQNPWACAEGPNTRNIYSEIVNFAEIRGGLRFRGESYEQG